MTPSSGTPSDSSHVPSERRWGPRDKATAERQLRGLLWLFGGFGLLALGPTMMPRGWLAAAVEWAEPGVSMGFLHEYLARSLSGMCFLFGGLLCLAATDVRRYAPMIRWMAGFQVGGGGLQGILLAAAPYPKNLIWYLLITDGGIIALGGLAMWGLLRKVEKSPSCLKDPGISEKP